MPNYPLRALRTLLAEPAPTAGVLIRTERGLAYVATSAGIVLATLATTIEPGQRVMLRNGIAFAERRPTSTYSI